MSEFARIQRELDELHAIELSLAVKKLADSVSTLDDTAESSNRNSLEEDVCILTRCLNTDFRRAVIMSSSTERESDKLDKLAELTEEALALAGSSLNEEEVYGQAVSQRVSTVQEFLSLDRAQRDADGCYDHTKTGLAEQQNALML